VAPDTELLWEGAKGHSPFVLPAMSSNHLSKMPEKRSPREELGKGTRSLAVQWAFGELK